MVQAPVEDREPLLLARALCAIADPGARRIVIGIAEIGARGAPVLVDETDADHDPVQNGRWLDEYFRDSMS